MQESKCHSCLSCRGARVHAEARHFVVSGSFSGSWIETLRKFKDFISLWSRLFVANPFDCGYDEFAGKSAWNGWSP